MVQSPGKTRTKSGALDTVIRRPLIFRGLFCRDGGKRNQVAGGND